MKPDFETMKQELLKIWKECNHPFLPQNRDFKLQYKFYRHRSSWRISLCMVWNKNEWTTVNHISDHFTFEEALKETYRLNGWGEPKNIRQSY